MGNRQGCKALGIRYEHLPELGIPSAERRNLRTQADYDALFDRYARDHLPKQTDALATITDWIEGGEYVALTCYERHLSHCHRRCISTMLNRLTGNATHCRDL